MLSTSARDPFSTPCEKAIPEPYYPVIITIKSSSPSSSHHKYPVLVVSIGIQLQVSVTVGQAIDRCFLPCRGAPTYPPRSLNSGRTHWLGPARPRLNNTTQPDRKPPERIEHAGLILCPRGSGPSPRTLRTLRGRSVADLATPYTSTQLHSGSNPNGPLNR